MTWDGSRLSRRAFIAAGAAALGAACSDDRRARLLPLEPNLTVFPTGLTVQIISPTSLLLLGSSPLITGFVRDNLARGVAREPIGIEDGLQGHPASVTTDASGKFSYRSRVLFADLCLLSLIVRGQRYPFLFQAVRQVRKNLFEADSAQVRGVVVSNTSTRDAVATLIGPANQTTSIFARRKAKTTILKHDPSSIPRVSVFGGFRLSAAVTAIADSVDIHGVETLPFAGTAFEIRGEAYAASRAAFAVSWLRTTTAGSVVVSVNAGSEIGWGTRGFRMPSVKGANAPALGITSPIKLRVA